MFRILLAFSFAILLFSCGLRYYPPPSVQELQTERRTSLEEQLGSDFKGINKTYVNLLYGTSATVKPESFKKLDSLFNLKYLAERSGRSVEELDHEIEVQRGIVLSDTTELLYKETVWGELISSDKLEFMIMETFQNNQNVLRKVNILESFDADKSDSTWAVSYFVEKPFLGSTMGITQDERNFYGFMKNRAVQLAPDERDVFLKNVFLIMRIGSQERSLSTDLILRKLAAYRLQQLQPELMQDDLTFLAEKVTDADVVTYEVTVTSKTNPAFRQLVRYDSFFYPLEDQEDSE